MRDYVDEYEGTPPAEFEFNEPCEVEDDGVPPCENLADAILMNPPLKSELIDGVLRKGHKLLLAGPSKAGKSFALIELCVCIAAGKPWLGRFHCEQGKVLYINLELDKASCLHRFKDVCDALEFSQDDLQCLHNIRVWHLRGYPVSWEHFLDLVCRRVKKRGFDAVIIDPFYKLNAGCENNAQSIAQFCNGIDRIAAAADSAVICCHHHSKGDQGQKRAQDRASGSGVFARDPDALIDMIELEIDDDRREQILNRWSCEAISSALDQCVRGWRDRISQDDALVTAKLADLAVELLGQAKALQISSEAEARAEQATGWRIGGILREFATFKPRNAFFCYPVHPLDKWELLADSRAEGEEPPRRNRQEAIAEQREIKNAETRMVVEELFQKQSTVEISDVARSLGITEKTVRERLQHAGIRYRKGDVINPNESNVHD